MQFSNDCNLPSSMYPVFRQLWGLLEGFSFYCLCPFPFEWCTVIWCFPSFELPFFERLPRFDDGAPNVKHMLISFRGNGAYLRVRIHVASKRQLPSTDDHLCELELNCDGNTVFSLSGMHLWPLLAGDIKLFRCHPMTVCFFRGAGKPL